MKYWMLNCASILAPLTWTIGSFLNSRGQVLEESVSARLKAFSIDELGTNFSFPFRDKGTGLGRW